MGFTAAWTFFKKSGDDGGSASSPLMSAKKTRIFKGLFIFIRCYTQYCSGVKKGVLAHAFFADTIISLGKWSCGDPPRGLFFLRVFCTHTRIFLWFPRFAAFLGGEYCVRHITYYERVRGYRADVSCCIGKKCLTGATQTGRCGRVCFFNVFVVKFECKYGNLCV